MNETDKTELEIIQVDKISQQLDEKFKEWKSFAFQNRTLDTVIAFTLGVAFSKVVTAISEGLIMPIIQFFGNYTGENWREMSWTPFGDLTFEIGKLYAAATDFLLTSIILFIIWKLLGRKHEDGHENREHQKEG